MKETIKGEYHILAGTNDTVFSKDVELWINELEAQGHGQPSNDEFIAVCRFDGWLQATGKIREGKNYDSKQQ